MRRTVIRKRPHGVEGVSERSSLAENPGVPKSVGYTRSTEVLLWKFALQVQRTVSPGWIVTEEGVKTGPPLPTVTVTVAALPTVGLKARTATTMPTNTAKQREEVFIASII